MGFCKIDYHISLINNIRKVTFNDKRTSGTDDDSFSAFTDIRVPLKLSNAANFEAWIPQGKLEDHAPHSATNTGYYYLNHSHLQPYIVEPYIVSLKAVYRISRA